LGVDHLYGVCCFRILAFAGSFSSALVIRPRIASSVPDVGVAPETPFSTPRKTPKTPPGPESLPRRWWGEAMFGGGGGGGRRRRGGFGTRY